MLDKVFPGIYKTVLTDKSIEQGVSAINIYLIPGKDGERSLMIDCGFHREHCLKQLLSAMEELKISPDRLDVFLTHRHHDHSGLAGKLSALGANIHMNPEEERHPYDCLTYKPTEESARAQKQVLRWAGVTEKLCPEVYQAYQNISDAMRAQGEWVLEVTSFPYVPVHAGDVFSYGDYHLRTVPLRGHTYGQMGLMDDEKKLFFAADQLIIGISPIVATTYPDEGLLQSFFDSLEYIKRRCTQGWTVFSAHGDSMIGGAELRKIVDKSVFSYLDKCSLVKGILEESKLPMTARSVMELCYHVKEAPGNEAEFFKYKMTLTKTHSILEYLKGIDFVDRQEINGTFYWSMKEL